MSLSHAIAFTADSGAVEYLIPATSALTLEQIAQKDIPPLPDGSARPHRVLGLEELPDPYFQTAWVLGEEGLGVDLAKAKAVQRQHWRELRAPKLAALDVQALRALEAGDAPLLEAISAQKQELRDVTATSLPDELEAIKQSIPACLL